MLLLVLSKIECLTLDAQDKPYAKTIAYMTYGFRKGEPVAMKVKREVTFSVWLMALMFFAVVQTSQNTLFFVAKIPCFLWHHRLSTGIVNVHFVKFPASLALHWRSI